MADWSGFKRDWEVVRWRLEYKQLIWGCFPIRRGRDRQIAGEGSKEGFYLFWM